MKSARIELRVSQATLRWWRARAKRADMTLSEWIRKRCEPVVQISAGNYVVHDWKWSGK